MEIGGELDSKGYGIGVPKNSPYRDALSSVILRLSEEQVLLNLYNKWWNVSSFLFIEIFGKIYLLLNPLVS